MTAPKAAHTPGPWKADHSGFGDATVRAENGWTNKDGTPFNPTLVSRIDWPTARLIAAAPEMLDELETLDAELSHASDCARRFHDAAECTCYRTRISALLARIDGTA